jgi:hypothetical protein
MPLSPQAAQLVAHGLKSAARAPNPPNRTPKLPNRAVTNTQGWSRQPALHTFAATPASDATNRNVNVSDDIDLSYN